MIFNSLPSLCIRVQSKQIALMCINLMLFHPLTSLICFSKAQKGHLRKNSLCSFVYVPHLSHLLAIAFIYSHTTTQTDIDTSITAGDWFALYSEIFMNMLVSHSYVTSFVFRFVIFVRPFFQVSFIFIPS